jgi:dihydrofolate reductase
VRCSVFIATSLDGYIARADGAIDWLPMPEAGEDYGYKAFMSSVDAIVIGRNTYDLVQTFGEWPYGRTRVVILSSRGVDVPPAIAETTESMSAPPAEVVGELAGRGMKHLYIDGGRTIQGFLAAGLITDLIITRIPILIGQGIPLFGALEADVKLRHTGTYSYPTGLVQSRYEVAEGPHRSSSNAG